MAAGKLTEMTLTEEAPSTITTKGAATVASTALELMAALTLTTNPGSVVKALTSTLTTAARTATTVAMLTITRRAAATIQIIRGVAPIIIKAEGMSPMGEGVVSTLAGSIAPEATGVIRIIPPTNQKGLRPTTHFRQTSRHMLISMCKTANRISNISPENTEEGAEGPTITEETIALINYLN